MLLPPSAMSILLNIFGLVLYILVAGYKNITMGVCKFNMAYHSINLSILKWPKWINRCKDHYKDITNISNMNNMSAALGMFLVCCRRYEESLQKSHV